MTIQELQAAFTAFEAQVTANIDAEASAVLTLTKLGDLLRANANDPAIVLAIADAMTNRRGALSDSAATLAAAVVANTPSA